MTFEDAKSALSEAANAPESSSTPAMDAVRGTSAPAPSTPEVDAGTTGSESDSFTNIDPSTLSPELQTIYRQMQGDYTRKAQEAAELRKQFDGIDPNQARQSIEFINALETDPNFVLSVHAQLTEALVQAGYTPAEAKAAAAEAIDDRASLGGDDEYVDPATSQLARELEELKAWRANQEAQQYEQNLAARLQRQEMSIRAADPSLQEQEIDRIYELAFAHGGDLERAHQAYSTWKNDVLGSYLETKSQPHQVQPIDSSGHSIEPPKESFSLDEGYQMAKEYLRTLEANS